jgi:hypothetical protein
VVAESAASRAKCSLRAASRNVHKTGIDRFLIQAPSFWVYIANLAVPISAVASEVDLNGSDDDRYLVLYLLGGTGGNEQVRGTARATSGFHFRGLWLGERKAVLIAPAGSGIRAPVAVLAEQAGVALLCARRVAGSLSFARKPRVSSAARFSTR